jgi:mRNA interferase MazF
MYKKGDILLINFPFTDLKSTKKRPILVIQDENDLNDFVCFQITSQSTQSKLLQIQNNHLIDGTLKLTSYLKYDKCFTLNSTLVNKKIAKVSDEFLSVIRDRFCDEVF